MVSDERMKNLEMFVQNWRDVLNAATAEFNKLIEFRRWSATIKDSVGTDILDARIMAQDDAIKQYQRALTHSESVLGRARAGQDV
jgi:hypothetical protein